MRRALIALALLAAAALAGCGAPASSAEDFEGQERAVAETVEELQSAAEGGDAQRICSDILAPVLVDRLGQGGTSCEDELSTTLDDADDLELAVTDVTISGQEAQARVTGEGGDATLQLVRAEGGWRVSDLGSAAG